MMKIVYYCEECSEEVDRDDVDSNHDHVRCGNEVYEIAATNFAAWGNDGYPCDDNQKKAEV